MDQVTSIIVKFANKNNKCANISITEASKLVENIQNDVEVQQMKACAITNMLQKFQVKTVNVLIQCSKDLQHEFTLEPLSTGEQGETMLMFVQNTPFAILKFGYSDDIEMLHEIAIGLMLNTLRNATPNFMYMYGGLACSLPFDKKRFQTIQDITSQIVSIINSQYVGLIRDLYEDLNIDEEEYEYLISMEDMSNFMAFLPALREYIVTLSRKRTVKSNEKLINILKRLLVECKKYPTNLEAQIKQQIKQMIHVYENNLQPLLTELQTLNSTSLHQPSLLCANNDVNVMYFAEFIDGISLREFIAKYEDEHEIIASLLLQVFISCLIAYEAYCYQHNDLHWENILVVKMTKNKQRKISYVLNGKNISFSSSYVARIIDYGLSETDTLKPSSAYYDPERLKGKQFDFLNKMVVQNLEAQRKNSFVTIVQKCFALQNNHEAIKNLLLRSFES